MEQIIPLVSSGTEGPLGLKHLPRLWLKALLSAKGRLPDGYKDVRPGLDYIVLEGLGLDPDAVRYHLFTALPTYPAFERWVCEQSGVDVSRANLAAINERIVQRMKPAEVREQVLAECGLPPDAPIGDAIRLNDLDDWRAVHELVTAV